MGNTLCVEDVVSMETPSRIVTDHGKDFEIFVTGDVHGSGSDVYARLSRVVREMDPDRGDSIVWAGDVGVCYGPYDVRWEMLDHMEDFGSDCGILSVIMRGNHDTRYCRDIMNDRLGLWHSDRWCGIEVLSLDAYPHVLFVADSGSLLSWRDMSVMLIPGAFSVDRDLRLAYGWPYEPSELLTWSEWETVLDFADAGADAVISHTCPEVWMELFSDLLIPGLDQSRLDHSMERGMNAVLDRIGDRCRAWLFGHFHDDRDVPGTCGRMLFEDVVRLSDEVR